MRSELLVELIHPQLAFVFFMQYVTHPIRSVDVDYRPIPVRAHLVLIKEKSSYDDHTVLMVA